MSGSVTSEFLHEAATLVARQRGAVRRLRSRHQPRWDGSCAGCGDRSRTRWPCVLITIADLSATIYNTERGFMGSAKTDDPGKHEDDRDGKGVPQPDKWKDPNKK